MMNVNESESPTPLEIRDPSLNSTDILRRIEAEVYRRRAENKYPAAEMLQSVWQQLTPDAVSARVDDDYIFQLLKTLTVDSYLQEVRFSSTVPVVGWLIVAIRRAWNWMSTRWYVLPVLKQQSRYNEQVIISMYRLLQTNRALQQQVDELQRQLSNLENTSGSV